ncbi:MAG: MSCRAMM family adhesin SdrC [Deltaproteobacteria bacterium]|nr:MSCRAMM family adhesin SdrC [Deltaproteobacteria bacterium]
MATKKNIAPVVAILAFLFVGVVPAFAGVPVWVGDYVWYDANNNGLQDDGDDSGLNGIRVDYYRDYDCNGVIDGSDEYYDYDFTSDDEFGNPGYYLISTVSNFCHVAMLDESTIPDGLVHTTSPILGFRMPDHDYWDVDFGLGETPPPPPAGFTCPKTIGFWKQQFKGGKSSKYSAAELNAIVAEALTLTDVFSTYADFNFFLNIKGNEGPLARAKRQFAAFTLNLAAFNLSDSVDWQAGLDESTPLDSSLTDADTVGDAFDEVESFILAGINLGIANDLADAINNGLGIDVDCPEED